jgi:uncharacterized delta-60 repeat protein
VVIAAGVGAVGVQLLLEAAAAPAASLNVTANITGSTTVDTTGCAANTSATSFGGVLPSSSVVTTVPCVVNFGTSDDTSMLRLSQLDGSGTALNKNTDGTADTGFGPGGMSTYATGGTDGGDGGLALQSSGLLLQAGSNGGNFEIVRRLANGNGDPAFGSGSGLATIDVGATDDHASGMATLPDDSIIVVGNGTFSGNDDSEIVKVLPNGSGLDTTFGSGGKLHFDAGGGGPDQAEGVAALHDGSLIVAGEYQSGIYWRPYVTRFSSTGVQDTTWGTNGYFRDVTGNVSGSYSVNVASLDDQRLVLTWSDNNTTAVAEAVDARTGQVDTTWGTSGKTILDAWGTESWQASGVGPNGTFYMAGNSGGAGQCGLARLGANGQLDPTFNSGAVLKYTVPGATADWCDMGVVASPEGGAYVAGDGTVGGVDIIHVEKILPNGSGLDTSWASSGARTFNYGTLEESQYGGVVMQDGRIYLGGDGGAGSWDLIAARVGGGASVPDYGTNTWAAGSNFFGVCLKSDANASNVWTVAPGNTCGTSDGGWWHAVPTSDNASAKVATAGAGVTNGSVSLIFGLKSASNQSPGLYTAPILVDVLSPMV